MIEYVITKVMSLKKFLPLIITEPVKVKNGKHVKFYVCNVIYHISWSRVGGGEIFFRRHGREEEDQAENVRKMMKKTRCDAGSARVERRESMIPCYNLYFPMNLNDFIKRNI